MKGEKYEIFTNTWTILAQNLTKIIIKVIVLFSPETWTLSSVGLFLLPWDDLFKILWMNRCTHSSSLAPFQMTKGSSRLRISSAAMCRHFCSFPLSRGRSPCPQPWFIPHAGHMGDAATLKDHLLVLAWVAHKYPGCHPPILPRGFEASRVIGCQVNTFSCCGEFF